LGERFGADFVFLRHACVHLMRFDGSQCIGLDEAQVGGRERWPRPSPRSMRSKRAGPDCFQVFGAEFVKSFFDFQLLIFLKKIISGPKFIKIKD
jgi:hypothetical protein